MYDEIAVLKVSATTEPKKLGGAIVKTLEEGKRVVLKAMGAESVNQAVKGIIVGRGYVASSAKDIKIVPGFELMEGTAEKPEITVVVFNLSLVQA